MKCHGCRGLGGTLHPDFALGAAPAEAESGKACHLVDEMHHRAFLQERVWNFIYLFIFNETERQRFILEIWLCDLFFVFFFLNL